MFYLFPTEAVYEIMSYTSSIKPGIILQQNVIITEKVPCLALKERRNSFNDIGNLVALILLHLGVKYNTFPVYLYYTFSVP